MTKWRDWYAPREIKFTNRAALWLIQNLVTLREGYWPADPTNRIDADSILKKGGGRAYFETPIEYAVEITRRMEKCGIDGLILLAIECWGESEYTLVRYLGMPVWSIRKRKKRALAYVASGPVPRWQKSRKRKGQTYEDYRRRPGKK